MQLRDDYITNAHPSRLPPSHPRYAEIVARHLAAVGAGKPCYWDPDTGLSVFTAEFLASRGWCCESGCRHCPFLPTGPSP